MSLDYEIERHGPIRTRGEIIFDRVCYAFAVALLIWLAWACLAVPG